MKNCLMILLLLIIVKANAQTQYEVTTATRHSQQKVLRGIVNKNIVKADTSFSKWYEPNQRYYTPDSVVVNAMVSSKGKVQFILFGGTWCEDTQFILPKFFKLQEMAGIADEQVSFFAVNEDKKSLGNITQAFGITNVPTIIVMKEGKEIGRVVEYGKTGKWDRELADLLNK